MQYTVRYAHLESIKVRVGQELSAGDVIGIMGTTGQSTAAHLHIDCTRGEQKERFRLADIDIGKIDAAPYQLNLFIDKGLFGINPFITSYYADPDYQRVFKKVHYGYDVVPENRKTTKANFGILWNRTAPGRVVFIDNDPAGTGNCVYIAFDV